MSVVLVDWLGRGGIAECSEAWAIVLADAGIRTVVVTRPDRELGSGTVAADAAPKATNKIAAHRAVAAHAAAVIRRERPAAVVVQNYVIPVLEAPVYRAARDVGARVVVAVHDQRLHSRWAGTSAGLTGILRRADVVLAHSHFVGDAVGAASGRDVQVIPVPVQVGMLDHVGPVPFAVPADGMLAVHFGVLRRGYKGTDTVLELADAPPAGWHLAVLGVGAPTSAGLLTVDRFLEPAELVAAVRRAHAALLPYRWATQSGAVVLAQALGAVPVATAVGGIPEQIEDGRTGRLVELDAGASAWRAVLEELSDTGSRERMVHAGRAKVWADHDVFVRSVTAIGSGG